MSSNPFDQFDSVSAEVNPFDQFDDGAVAANKQPDRTLKTNLQDVAATAAKGITGLGDAMVGVANIPTMGQAGRSAKLVGLNEVYDSPQEAESALAEHERGVAAGQRNQYMDQSPYSAPQQYAQQQVTDAKGVTGKLSAAISNPSTIATAIGESLPTMVAGGLAGGAISAATKLSPVVGAAIGEGLMGAGAAAEQIRQESPTGTLTPGQTAMALGSGIGTAAFGYAGGALAKRLGLTDVDTLFASGFQRAAKKAGLEQGEQGFAKTAADVAKRIVGGGISEGVFEELPQSIQEQMWQNAATGKPLSEGVDEAAAMGLLSGAAMGGGINILPQAKEQSPLGARVPPPPVGPEPAQPADPTGPISRAVGTAPITGQVAGPGMAATATPPPVPTGPLGEEWNIQAQEAAAYNQQRNELGQSPIARASLMGTAPAGGIDPAGIEQTLNQASLERNQGTGLPVTPDDSLLAQGGMTEEQIRAEKAAAYRDLFAGPTVLSDEAEQRLSLLERRLSEGEVGSRWQRQDTSTSDGQVVPGEWDGVKSTNPEWLKSGPLKEVGKAGIAMVIAKARNGEALTNRQEAIWVEVKKAADFEWDNDPATAQAREAERIQGDLGIELQDPQKLAVGNLNTGDKVVVVGKNGIPDVVEHKGWDDDGNAILKDGVTIHADPFDTVDSMGMVKAPAGQDYETRMREFTQFGPKTVNEPIRRIKDANGKFTETAREFLDRRKADQQIRQGAVGVDNTPANVPADTAGFIRDQKIRSEALGTEKKAAMVRAPGETLRSFIARQKAEATPQTQPTDHRTIAEAHGFKVESGPAPKHSGGFIIMPDVDDATFASTYGADKKTVTAHEVAHGLLNKWAMTGEIKGPAYADLRKELRGVSRSMSQKKWESHARHADKSQELLADGIAHLILNEGATLPQLEKILGTRIGDIRRAQSKSKPQTNKTANVTDRQPNQGVETDKSGDISSQESPSPAPPTMATRENTGELIASGERETQVKENAATLPSADAKVNLQAIQAPQPTESELADVGLVRKWGDKWQYKFRADQANFFTADTKEAAIERATAAWNKSRPEERLTGAQRYEKANREWFSDMDSRYGKMSDQQLEDLIAEQGKQGSSNAKSARREMNGNGGRRTGAAVSAEAVRDFSEMKRNLERYLAERGRASEQVPTVKESLTVQPAGEFANNKVFTADKVAAARERLKAKRGTLSSGLDPELMQDLLVIGGAHFEAGVRNFSAWAKAVVADIGEEFKPFLRGTYENLRHYPGIEKDGMSAAAEIDAIGLDEKAAAADNKGTEKSPPPQQQEADNVQADSEVVPEAKQPGRIEATAERGEGDRVPARPGEELPRAGGSDSQADVGKPARRSNRKSKSAQYGENDSQGSIDERPERVALEVAGPQNYRITEADRLGKGGAKQKARDNIKAISILKQLRQENRPATADEQAQLVKYVGWGASELANGMFPQKGYDPGSRRYVERYKDEWKTLGEELRSLLTDDEYNAAKASTINAHYTSEKIIKGMYSALERFGYAGKGRALEPGSGVGHFIGLLPDAFTNTRFTTVEMDPISAGIAKALYPGHDVRNADFAKFKAPDNFFDIAIGNPPFADIEITSDPDYSERKFKLHDYFFAKSIDKVRPGGLMILVTSRYTMDKGSDKARSYLAKRADLLGAIRLPQTAFKENAGTEVVTDVLFLRKRLEGERPAGQAWGRLEAVKAGDKEVHVNEYFAANPEMVLGKHSTAGTMYGPGQYTVEPKPGDIAEQFSQAVARLPENVYQADKSAPTPTDSQAVEAEWSPSTVKEGAFYVTAKGEIRQKENGMGAPVAGVAKKKAVIKDFVRVRDAVRQILYVQLKGEGDLAAAQKELGLAYDAFVAEHGPLNKSTEVSRTNKNTGKESASYRYPNFSHFKSDPDAYLVAAVEKYDDDTGTAEKTDIFTKRVISPTAEPRIESLVDALHVSLHQTGEVDLQMISEAMGVDGATAIEGLDGAIYRDPNGNRWVTADEYLSGNVRRKLAAAQAAADIDPKYKTNVTALEAVQPQDLPPSRIKVSLGMPIIQADDVESFAAEVMQLGIGVRHISATGAWDVVKRSGYQTFVATNDYGTDRLDAADLIDAALNNRTVKVYDRDRDGKQIFNRDATEAAFAKLQKIRDRFSQWVWEDAGRSTNMARKFNDLYNNTIKREYGGDHIKHMQFPGMSAVITPHEHQKRVAWRIVQRGNTYMAHSVGAGKTIGSIIAGMELKRLGIKKKPMWVVPNHMLKQFSSEFQQLYPAAKLLVADEEQFAKGNRNRFMGRIAAENWDGIIITHSAFGKVPVSEDYQRQFIGEQVEELEEMMIEAGGDRTKTKQLERQKKRLEQRLEKILNNSSKDKGVSFEESGIDQLFVDEAHQFRKLDFVTNQTSISGIDPNGSMMAFDLYVKTRYLETLYPGRSMVMMSGTPVTNTIGEVYTIQRFLSEPALRELGIHNFDAWASTFGESVTELVATPAGTYQPKTRFGRFRNMPSLAGMWGDIGDFVHAKDLPYLKRPMVDGGGRKFVIGTSSDIQKAYKQSLAARLKVIKDRKGPPQKGEDIILTVITDGRHAALDERFIAPNAPPRKDAKLDMLVDKVHDIWRESAEKRSTQMIFADLGLPQAEDTRGFSVYKYIKQELIRRGIPEAEVAFMQDYSKSDEKQKLFNAMNAGDVRVLIGSSAAMGTGVNAQRKLVALHHFDPDTYLPSNIEQREGRIVRQGNENDLVQLYVYLTKGSYDETMWQFIESKQRFIDQFLAGSVTEDTVEDIDGAANQFAEARAMSSDNPLVLELAGVENDISKLESLRRAHVDGQVKMSRDRSYAEHRIGTLEKLLPAIEAAAGARTETKGESFSMEFKGKSYKDRTEAGKGLVKMLKAQANKPLPVELHAVGSIGGFTLKVRSNMLDHRDLVFTLWHGKTELQGKVQEQYKITTIDGEEKGPSPSGLVMRLENMARGVDGELDSIKTGLAKAKHTIKEADNRLGSKFEQVDVLEEKRARADEIRAQLEREGSEEQRDSAPEGDTEPKLSQSTTPTPGTTIAEGERELGRYNHDLVTIVQSVEDLPAGVESSSTVSGNIQGAFDSQTGKIHLVADNIPAGQWRKVLEHEGFHRGMATGQFDAIMDDLQRMDRMFSKGTGKMGEWFAKARESAQVDLGKPHYYEEIAAYAVAQYEQAPNVIRRWVDRLIAKVKLLMRQIGIRTELTQAMLREIALRGLRGPAAGVVAPTVNPEVKFSVAAGDTGPMSLDNLAEAAQDMARAASKGSITFKPNTKKDSTFLHRLLSTPEYYFKKTSEAAGRVLQAALLRRDVRFEKQKEILGDFVKFVQNLRKTDKVSYEEANAYLVEVDQEGGGFKVKERDGQWVVVGPDKKDVSEHASETEAIEAMIASEGEALKEDGYSQASIEAVKMARELTNRAFDVMAADMRRIIAEAAANGRPNPFIGSDKIDEAGRYGVYAKGSKAPLALFATEREAMEKLGQASEMMSYSVVSAKGKVKEFTSVLKARAWAAKRGGKVEGTKRFGNLTVKKRTDSEMRPLTVKEALAQMGDLRGSYFPRIRENGEYVLIARKDGENPFRQSFDLPGAGDSNKLQSVLNSVTPIGRKAKELKAKGYTVTISKDDKPTDDVFDATSLITSIDALVQSAMEGVNKNDSAEIKAAQVVDQIITMEIADIFKARGYLASRMKRLTGDETWEGYETDMGKALTQYGKNIAAGTAKRDTARAMVLAFTGRDYSWNDYKQEVDNPSWEEYKTIVEARRIDPGKQKNLFKDVRGFIVDVLRNDEQTDRIVGTMKGLAVHKFLGFRVSSAAVNATNMVTGVVGTMSGHTGEPLNQSLRRVMAAATAYTKYRSGIGSIPEGDREIFQEITDRGWDEAQFDHEAMSELRGKMGDAWNKYEALSMFAFSAVEKANRAMTVFAALKAVNKKNPGMDKEARWNLAHEICNNAHGVYGKETLPAMARGGDMNRLLRLPLTFTKFTHNYMLNAIDLGFNKKEWKAMAYLLLSPAVLAGSGATLATPLLVALASARGIGGDDPEEAWYSWAEETFGGGTFARHGLAGLAGINIKGSMAINVPMPSDIAKVKLVDIFGPVGGVVGDVAMGAGSIAKGDVAKGIEALLPTAFGSMSKALRESSEGITTSNYGSVFYGDEPLKANDMDAFLRFWSFNPSRISGIREKQWNEKEVAAKYQERRADIYRDIKRDRLQGKGVTPESLKEIKRYNDLVAGSGRRDLPRITPQSLRAMLKRQAVAPKNERLRARSKAMEATM